MNAEKAAALLKVLGAHNIGIGEQWVKASCVFAPWVSAHKGGVDRNPSFGIKINDTGRSMFNCFACHKHGDLDTLMVELMHYASQGGHKLNLKAGFEMVEQENDEAYYDAGEWTEGGGKPPVVFEPFPEWFLEAFPSSLKVKAARDYLHSRGMTDEHIEHFDVRYDQFKQRVCFPYRSNDGELAGIRGRDVFVNPMSNKKPHFDYKYNGHSNIGITWYGEHEVSTNKPLLVVEGQMDRWSVWRVYDNVVANLSSGTSHFKLSRLQYFPEVIFFYDADGPGKEAADMSWQYLRKKTTCYAVEWAPEHYEQKLDPGKCSTKLLRTLLADYVDLS